MSKLFAIIFTILGFFFFSGCKADEGELCTIDSDCSNGLLCENAECVSLTSGPIPSDYPLPIGSDKCRATFDLFLGTASFGQQDVGTTNSNWLVNSGSIMYFKNIEGLILTLPSINIGSYICNQTTGLSNPATVLAYDWGSFTDYTFDTTNATGNINVLGNQSDYRWGNFYGSNMGSITPYTNIENGKFACIP